MAVLDYTVFLEGIWLGLFDPTGNSYKVAICGAGYTPSAAHVNIDDLDDVLADGTLDNVTFDNGVMDADDTLVSGPIADDMKFAVLYISTGISASSRLMRCFSDGVGFNVTPDGNVLVIWPNGAGKIFPVGGIA